MILFVSRIHESLPLPLSGVPSDRNLDGFPLYPAVHAELVIPVISVGGAVGPEHGLISRCCPATHGGSSATKRKKLSHFKRPVAATCQAKHPRI